MRIRLLILILALTCAPAARASLARVLNVWAEDPSMLDVQVVHTDGTAIDAKEGLAVSEADRVRTGYKSHARLDFGGKATVVVDELSELKVGILKLGKKNQVELWLKAGEVSAQVRKEAASRTEFAVRTPTATASVRGTIINSILYSPERGMLIAMGQEGNLHATPREGPAVAVGHDQRAQQDTEVRTFHNDADLKLGDSHTFVTPAGVTSQEQEAANLSPLSPQPSVNTISSGSSLGPLAPSVVSSPLPSVLAVLGELDPAIPSNLLSFGFNPVVTTDATALGGNLSSYVGVLIAKGTDASPFASQIQAYHDAGHGVVFDSHALVATLTSPTLATVTGAVPAYLGGGTLLPTDFSTATVTPQGEQLTGGAVPAGTTVTVQQVSSGASAQIFGSQATAVLAQTSNTEQGPGAALVFHDDGKGRAAYVGIEVNSSSEATTLTRAVARKVGGLNP